MIIIVLFIIVLIINIKVNRVIRLILNFVMDIKVNVLIKDMMIFINGIIVEWIFCKNIYIIKIIKKMVLNKVFIILWIDVYKKLLEFII